MDDAKELLKKYIINNQGKKGITYDDIFQYIFENRLNERAVLSLIESWKQQGLAYEPCNGRLFIDVEG
jgi:hypothetical protein